MKKEKRCLYAGIIVLALFVLFTVLVKTVDVKPIGPMGSSVGFASLNKAFINAVKTDERAYKVSEYLGYLAIVFVAAFALQGFIQLIKYKSLRNVNPDLLLFGGFLVVLLGLYIGFDKFVINYRPILENGVLESSYPSSHTLLAVFVYIAGAFEFTLSERSKKACTVIAIFCGVFSVVTVLTRTFSGYHWITDIIGGVLLSTSLVLLFLACVFHFIEKDRK